MKLKEANKIAKEKGFDDISLCVDHIICNTDKYFNFITQNIEFELKELLSEEKLYLEGKLEM